MFDSLVLMFICPSKMLSSLLKGGDVSIILLINYGSLLSLVQDLQWKPRVVAMFVVGFSQNVFPWGLFLLPRPHDSIQIRVMYSKAGGELSSKHRKSWVFVIFVLPAYKGKFFPMKIGPK